MAFRINALINETEALLREGLNLSPLSLEPALARAEGLFRGAPVVIETRAYSGPFIRFARFVLIEGGGLEIGNVLCLGEAPSPLPIFGADLVSITADGAMFAADLSPVLRGEEGTRLLEPLARRRALHPALPPGGELPAWCSAWFSPFALFTRVSASEGPSATAAYLDFPRAFLDIAHNARSSDPAAPLSAEINQAQESYLEDHRTQDKGLGMMAKMFGAEWASRYIQNVLFPRAADS